MLTIGSMIKKMRKRKNLTQTGLGQLIGTDDSAVRKYENSRSIPKEDTLIKIADALNVNPDSLLGSDLNFSKAMHHLFRIFDTYKGEFHTIPIKRMNDDGIEVDDELVTVSFNFLNEFMKEWKSQYEASASSNSNNAYIDYIYCFPESSQVNPIYKDIVAEYDQKLAYIENRS